MKCLTGITAVFILLLSIKPGIDIFFLPVFHNKACYKSQCTPLADCSSSEDENQQGDCNGKPCNPFQVCGSCVWASLTVPFEYVPKQPVSTKETFVYQSAFASQFASDIWQPPKIV